MQILSAVWIITCQLSPWLLLGMFIAGLMHVALPAGFIHRKLRGPSGVLQAVALGVPLPLCSCGVVPAGIGLKRDGASDGASVGFLISTPQTGVDSILVSASFLGWPFALFKVMSAAVTGIVGGLLADAVHRPTATTVDQADAIAGPANRNLRAMLDHASEILRSIWIWLVVGVFVSAAIDCYAPSSVFEQIADWGSVSAALVALSVSLPLYVCATASVPIAAVLVSNGLPPGAALVFLMAGPATNVATMGAIYRTFGYRTLAVYLGTIVLGSIGFAVAFDWLIPTAAGAEAVHHHESISWWEQAAAVLLVGILIRFGIDDLRRWLLGNRRNATRQGPGFTVAVSGMTCHNCVNRLEQKLQETEGVENAVVRLEPGQAVVHGTIDEQHLAGQFTKVAFRRKKW